MHTCIHNVNLAALIGCRIQHNSVRLQILLSFWAKNGLKSDLRAVYCKMFPGGAHPLDLAWLHTKSFSPPNLKHLLLSLPKSEFAFTPIYVLFGL